MADDLVAALAERGDHLRAIVVERGIDQQPIGQVVGLGELEQAPGADAVAVVAPGEAARVRLRMRRRVIVAQALAEGEVLDVQAEVHREALAAGPAVVLALGDRGVVVAAVRFQLHRSNPSAKRDILGVFSMVRHPCSSWLVTRSPQIGTPSCMNFACSSSGRCGLEGSPLVTVQWPSSARPSDMTMRRSTGCSAG